MKVQIYNIDLKLLQRKQKQNNNLKKNLKQVLQISAFNHNLLSKSPKVWETYCFCSVSYYYYYYYYYYYCYLLSKSPKRCLGDLLFLLRFLLLLLLFSFSFLSLEHELVHGRSQETTGQNFMKLGGVIDICF
jgi:hypothetical protein